VYCLLRSGAIHKSKFSANQTANEVGGNRLHELGTLLHTKWHAVPLPIRLAGASAIRSDYEDTLGLATEIDGCQCSEEGLDGLLDLTLKFKTQDVVAALGEWHDGDEVGLELNGLLFDAMPVEGSDCVWVRGNYLPFNQADFNRDGMVDMLDFLAFSKNWLSRGPF
jgi:hypothetical protein